MSVTPPGEALAAALAGLPATRLVAEAVLAAWPEHARYLATSLGVRGPATRATTERLAEAALLLADGRLATVAAHYRWTCDRLREEELHFHRTGRYRLSTFAEADAEVYSDPVYVARYMDGLLLSQVLWANHAESCHFFLTETPRHLSGSARYLEIGPGHGLMMALALRDFGLAEATAWDLSPVSVEQTRAALDRLGFAGRASFAVRDLMAPDPAGGRFDLVVLSEVLEHLEDPVAALEGLRGHVAPGGLVFVNVPINSPSPDHLYLVETPDDARALLRRAGFAIVAEGFFPTQGKPLDRALRARISVSACMLARPAG